MFEQLLPKFQNIALDFPRILKANYNCPTTLHQLGYANRYAANIFDG